MDVATTGEIANRQPLLTLDEILNLSPERVYGLGIRHLNPELVRLKEKLGLNLAPTHASGCYFTAHDGKVYMDLGGAYGVLSAGHNHPDISAALMRMLSEDWPVFTPSLISKFEVGLAENLERLGGLQHCFFVNAGTEANEVAFKLARKHTGKPWTVSEEGAFHGKTIAGLSVSGKDKYKNPFKPLLEGCFNIPFGDLEALEKLLSTGKVAAFFLEIVAGENGAITHTAEFLAGAARLCELHGTLLIIDEVQTGLGRTGATFAFEHYGLKPDIVTLGKALGGAYTATSAMMATPAVYETYNNMADMLLNSSTCGGNGLSCVAGIASLGVMVDNNLAQKAAETGKYLIDGLRKIANDYPLLIEEVTGMGLLAGIHFRVSGENLSKEDARELVGTGIVGELLKKGFLVIYSLNNPSIIRIEPPLGISKEEIDRFLIALREVLSEMKSPGSIALSAIKAVSADGGATVLVGKTIKAEMEKFIRRFRLLSNVRTIWRFAVAVMRD